MPARSPSQPSLLTGLAALNARYPSYRPMSPAVSTSSSPFFLEKKIHRSPAQLSPGRTKPSLCHTSSSPNSDARRSLLSRIRRSNEAHRGH
ncbi:hypothetical protein BJX62DRAFT_196168 [Aspergillus germanicus]